MHTLVNSVEITNIPETYLSEETRNPFKKAHRQW